jgi:UrcA family protein
MNKFAIAALVILSASGMNASRADVTTVSGEPTLVVRYQDLDLSSRDGNAKLYSRLKGAAAQICDKQLEHVARTSFSQTRSLQNSCLSHAIDGAVARINRPSFTEFVASDGKVWNPETRQVAKK